MIEVHWFGSRRGFCVRRYIVLIKKHGWVRSHDEAVGQSFSIPNVLAGWQASPGTLVWLCHMAFNRRAPVKGELDRFALERAALSELGWCGGWICNDHDVTIIL